MKLIQPFVEKVKAVSPNIEKLDNDALRARTQEIRKHIQESVTEQRAQIDQLKAKIEDTPIDERADIFAQIDKIEKEILDIFEEKLNEVMPEVFAIVKETAKRFATNEETVVTATDFDRELAADPRKDFITIDGDKAIYHKQHFAMQINQAIADILYCRLTQAAGFQLFLIAQETICPLLHFHLRIKLRFEPVDITVARIQCVRFSPLGIITQHVTQEIRTDIRLGHTIPIEAYALCAQVIVAVRQCRNEMSAEPPYIRLAHLPDTEETQDMIYAVGIEIILHI